MKTITYFKNHPRKFVFSLICMSLVGAGYYGLFAVSFIGFVAATYIDQYELNNNLGHEN